MAISLADRLMLPLAAWMRETMLLNWSTVALPSSRMRAKVGNGSASVAGSSGRQSIGGVVTACMGPEYRVR